MGEKSKKGGGRASKAVADEPDDLHVIFMRPLLSLRCSKPTRMHTSMTVPRNPSRAPRSTPGAVTPFSVPATPARSIATAEAAHVPEMAGALPASALQPTTGGEISNADVDKVTTVPLVVRSLPIVSPIALFVRQTRVHATACFLHDA